MSTKNEIEKEREACAEIAEDIIREIKASPEDVQAKMNFATLAARDIANRIRARGENNGK